MALLLRNDLGLVTRVAQVELYDMSRGVFGELFPPSTMGDATIWRSLSCPEDDVQVMMEIDNTTALPLVVRWIDATGHTPMDQVWRVPPGDSLLRFARLGHLFVLTTTNHDEEYIVGAYRIHMALPSGSPHFLRVEQMGDGGLGQDDDNVTTTFILEFILSDPSGQDELVVAAEALDSSEELDPERKRKTIQTLVTIIQNLQQHPNEPKFTCLRLSNAQVQAHLASHWGAMHLLHTVGFQETNIDTLTFDNNATNRQRLQQASRLLEDLQARCCQAGFVAELAPRPPWQGPPLLVSPSGGGGGFRTGTRFLSDDEKWKRAERNAKNRARYGRRPAPGQAPSSRGKWGR